MNHPFYTTEHHGDLLFLRISGPHNTDISAALAEPCTVIVYRPFPLHLFECWLWQSPIHTKVTLAPETINSTIPHFGLGKFSITEADILAIESAAVALIERTQHS